MLYKTTSAPQQTTEILQELLLYLRFIKENISNKRLFCCFFFTLSRFLQENPFINFAKDIFSARATYAGEQLQRKFLEIPRRGAPVLPGCLFSTCTEQSVSNGNPERWTFNFQFSSTLYQANRNQGSSGVSP